MSENFNFGTELELLKKILENVVITDSASMYNAASARFENMGIVNITTPLRLRSTNAADFAVLRIKNLAELKSKKLILTLGCATAQASSLRLSASIMNTNTNSIILGAYNWYNNVLINFTTLLNYEFVEVRLDFPTTVLKNSFISLYFNTISHNNIHLYDWRVE